MNEEEVKQEQAKIDRWWDLYWETKDSSPAKRRAAFDALKAELDIAFSEGDVQEGSTGLNSDLRMKRQYEASLRRTICDAIRRRSEAVRQANWEHCQQRMRSLGFKAGSRVTKYGDPGTIIRVHADGCVAVRLDKGVSLSYVSPNSLDPIE